MQKNTSIRVFKLVNCRLEAGAGLDELAIYNEGIEELSLRGNLLKNMGRFFKNLNANWLSKMSQLDLSDNQLSL